MKARFRGAFQQTSESLPRATHQAGLETRTEGRPPAVCRLCGRTARPLYRSEREETSSPPSPLAPA